jgi:hypothetical protein
VTAGVAGVVTAGCAWAAPMPATIDARRITTGNRVIASADELRSCMLLFPARLGIVARAAAHLKLYAKKVRS